MKYAVVALLGLAFGCSAAEPVSQPVVEEIPTLRVQIVEEAADKARAQEREAKADLHQRQREARADQHDQEDLAAQWLAARSADRQVLVAWVSLLLSALAAIGAFVSLWFTRQSLSIARHSALSVDRPWLTFDVNPSNRQVAGWTDGRFSAPLSVNICNVGKGPAINAHAIIKYQVLAEGGQQPWISAESFARSLKHVDYAFSKIIFANENVIQGFADSLADEDVKTGMGVGGNFYVQALIAVQYWIAGDDTHRCTAKSYVIGRRDPSGKARPFKYDEKEVLVGRNDLSVYEDGTAAYAC